MKGRSGRGSSAVAVTCSSTAAAVASILPPSTSPTVTLTHSQQADSRTVENERSESATTAQQMSPQVATPTPTASLNSPPSESEGGPPTPGNAAANSNPNQSQPQTQSQSIVTASPQYVTITAGNGSGARSYASLTPVLPVNATCAMVDGDTVTGETVGGNAAYVTYVEGSAADHTSLFATASSNGQTMSYPVYTVGETTGAIYSPGGSTTQYYTTTPNGTTPTALAYTQESGVTYLVPSTASNSISLEATDGQHNITHATRVSPATVQWLLENYETAEGVSLPRSTLYYHYLRHCNDHKLDPVNAASFGKLIRSVFLGLRTRRLGTRGNSKYHYYGIRLKPNSPLVHVVDECGENSNGNNIQGNLQAHAQSGQSPGPNHSQTLSSMNDSPCSQQENHDMSNSPHANDPGHGEGHGHGHGHAQVNDSCGNRSGNHLGNSNSNNNTNNNNNNGAKRLKITKAGDNYDSNESYGMLQYLGDSSSALDNLPELDLKIELPQGGLLSADDLLIFRTLYREHCESLLDTIASFQLSQVESYWRHFWRSAHAPNALSDHVEQEYEKLMPKAKLHLLCTLKEVQEFVRETDYQFYQNIVSILVPDVLRPIPSSMTQSIRNFAKSLESWLNSAMADYPAEIVGIKLSGVNALAQTLRRYTSLNHLAQAARAVLQNQNQIAQMLSDLNRVDFHNVEEQASWVCGCDGDMVPSLEQDFKATLAQQKTLEEWATWLEAVVDRILRPHLDSPSFVQSARHFLLKWSFYSSLVIRDLTLRSAASFGSFHLLRLLYDEYMFYLVEQRVAQVTGIVPIAVIGKKFHPSTSVQNENAGVSQANDGQIIICNGTGPGTVASEIEIPDHDEVKEEDAVIAMEDDHMEEEESEQCTVTCISLKTEFIQNGSPQGAENARVMTRSRSGSSPTDQQSQNQVQNQNQSASISMAAVQLVNGSSSPNDIASAQIAIQPKPENTEEQQQQDFHATVITTNTSQNAGVQIQTQIQSQSASASAVAVANAVQKQKSELKRVKNFLTV